MCPLYSVTWQISSGDNDIIIARVLFYRLRTRRELMRRPVRKGTGIGGWRPVKDRNGNIDTRLSPRFSVEIRREDWPWINERDDKPALVISTLEASAILIASKLFYGSTSADRKRVTVAPTWTDNRGNGALLNKLMTTKFPGCALLMELASFMKRRSMKVVVDWTPREGE